MQSFEMGRDLRDGIVVLGAGIVGVCTAWHLLRRGAKVTLIDRDAPGRGCSYGNAGALGAGSIVPLATPGIMRDALKMLLSPAAPLRIPPTYLPTAAPWLLLFLRASRAGDVSRISDALAALLAHSIEKHNEILSEVGASGLIRQTGLICVYPDARALAKDATAWRLRRERGVRVEELGRADILALEPEIGPDYTAGMYMPEQG